MNSRTIANLVLLFILLGFIAYYVSNQSTTSDIKRLTSLNIDEVHSIRIPRDEGDILLERKTINSESIWYMQKPYAIKAHQFRVNTLLGLTQAPINESFDISELDLSHYALDTPRAQIIYNKTKVSFGKSNPINNKRYLLANDKLVLLDDQVYPLISAQPATFVDLSLLPDSNITAISLPNFKITKSVGPHWISSSKGKADNYLSADQIQILLDNWKNAQAFAVHRYMPRKNLGQIVVSLADDEITFELSDDDPWLIIGRADLGIEYHLDASLKQTLFEPAQKNSAPQGDNDA